MHEIKWNSSTYPSITLKSSICRSLVSMSASICSVSIYTTSISRLSIFSLTMKYLTCRLHCFTNAIVDMFSYRTLTAFKKYSCVIIYFRFPSLEVWPHVTYSDMLFLLLVLPIRTMALLWPLMSSKLHATWYRCKAYHVDTSAPSGACHHLPIQP